MTRPTPQPIIQSDADAYGPMVHLLLKMRRELCASLDSLDSVTDPVPVVANYFDRLMDEVVPNPFATVREATLGKARRR